MFDNTALYYIFKVYPRRYSFIEKSEIKAARGLPVSEHLIDNNFSWTNYKTLN